MSQPELQTFIERSLAADSVEQVHRLCSGICDSFGFDHFIYGTSFPSSMVKPFILVISGHPDAWRERYQAQRYLTVDPAVRHCYSSLHPLVWQDLMRRSDTDRRGLRVMHEAVDFGLASGTSLPIRGGRGEVGVLSFSSERPMSETRRHIDHVLPPLFLLSAYVHEAAGRLISSGGLLFNPPALTPREQECLLWAAEGKTSWETAQILGISERTIVFHLQNASRKLNVTSRQQAVARAVSQGLITPQLY